MEYCIKRLGSITALITKGTTPSNIGETFTNQGVMFFRSELIGKTKHVDKSKGLLFISEETHKKLKRSQIKCGDLLFSIAGAYLGKLSLVAVDDVPSNTNQAVALIRFKPNVCNIDYVYYYMLQEWYNEYICSFNAQAAQPNINLEQISKLKLNLPSREKQDKIASILSVYDDLIENNNKRIKILEQMAENLYKEWFAYEKIKDISKEIRLKEIISIIRGVSYTTEEIETKEGTNLANLKNIQAYGGFRRDGLKLYAGKYKKEQIVSCGDLIMGVTDMTQDRRTVGYVALVPQVEGISVISADLIRISSSIPNVFLYAMFKYGNASKYISQFANGANVLHLKPQAILGIKILLPSQFLIDKYVNIASKFFNEIEYLSQMNCNLTKQRDMLLPRLMSGKLEVK